MLQSRMSHVLGQSCTLFAFPSPLAPQTVDLATGSQAVGWILILSCFACLACPLGSCCLLPLSTGMETDRQTWTGEVLGYRSVARS